MKTNIASDLPTSEKRDETEKKDKGNNNTMKFLNTVHSTDMQTRWPSEHVMKENSPSHHLKC